jgi:hypothetical protein
MRRPARQLLRAAARLVLGSDYLRVRTIVLEAGRRWRWRRSPLRRVTKTYVRRYGLTVRDGPFAGLTYRDAPLALVGKLVPKLLGCYERELHEQLRRSLAEDPPDVVVNIGAADGYYAVGLALATPSAHVHAYDQDPTGRRLCRSLARHNGVPDRVDVRGACDLDALRQLDGDRVLMMVDCEGCELEVLRPELVPVVRRATVIVELHDLIDPRISAALSARFAPTHDEERIPAVPRFLHDYPPVANLPRVGELERQLAVSELRPAQMEWSVFRPRGRRMRPM